MKHCDKCGEPFTGKANERICWRCVRAHSLSKQQAQGMQLQRGWQAKRGKRS
jgi:hypothetical protein